MMNSNLKGREGIIIVGPNKGVKFIVVAANDWSDTITIETINNKKKILVSHGTKLVNKATIHVNYIMTLVA